MTEFYPADPDDSDAQARWQIVDALRRYGTDSAKLAHAFGAGHDLQAVDVQALVAIMSAEGSGHPLTPGRLRAHLGLSSGGTSYVIDRLEQAGHSRRARDHPSDSRVVHLRYTEQGMATGMAFFGPLGRLTEDAMNQFDRSELAVVSRFLAAAAGAMHDHLASLTHPDPTSEPGSGFGTDSNSDSQSAIRRK